MKNMIATLVSAMFALMGCASPQQQSTQLAQSDTSIAEAAVPTPAPAPQEPTNKLWAENVREAWNVVNGEQSPDWKHFAAKTDRGCEGVEKAGAVRRLLGVPRPEFSLAQILNGAEGDQGAIQDEQIQAKIRSAGIAAAKDLYKLVAHPVWSGDTIRLWCEHGDLATVDIGNPAEVASYLAEFLTEMKVAKPHEIGFTPEDLRAATLMGIKETMPVLVSVGFHKHGPDGAAPQGEEAEKVSFARRQLKSYLDAGFSAKEIGFDKDPAELVEKGS